MIEKMVPASVKGYVAEHPKVLVWAGVALVAANLYNLYDAVRYLVRAEGIVRDATSEAARAASEALGG